MDNPGQFKAGNWLSCPPISTKSPDLTQNILGKSMEGRLAPSILESSFSPANYCVSGWNGESLMTPSALNISNLIEELSLEALKLIQDKDILTSSLKRYIYDEFISYAISEDLPLQGLETPEVFWVHAWDDYSPLQKTIQRFLKNYAFRTVTVYIFKIRFITQFCHATNIPYNKNNLVNPNSFIDKFFRKGSSFEFKCEALQPNQYSWYRPSINFQNRIFELAKNFHFISITQMMKICTYSTPENENEKKRALFDDKEISHAISHKSFGLFLNELILFLPYWLESRAYPQHDVAGKLPKVLNAKYSGKNLSALILSHWLAQEHNLKNRPDEWGELICPSFVGNNFFNGSFVRYCHELQFLTFLSQMAGLQGNDPIKLLSAVMQKKYEQAGLEHQGQTNFLGKDQPLSHRIVLNLSDLPPRNPHHALIFRLNNEAKHLAPDGMIFALTNQKLFVPSQEDKTKQLFEHFQLAASINFDELQGRGEIPAYLYVLKRRQATTTNTPPGFTPGTTKDHCLTFRIGGELKTFSLFQEIASEFSKFLSNPRNLHLPVFQSTMSEDLSFQFHQDFIIDGRLVHSDNEDPHCITHPSFIKNLAQACLPFDKFFRVETIKEESTAELLGISIEQKNTYPLLLVVDKSNPEHIRLEINSFDTYPAKIEKYGTAFYSYFGLIPKFLGINLNLFREYFLTRIGNQVVQISLGGSPSNLRSRVKGLLIPAFFASTSRPKEATLNHRNCFQYTAQDLMLAEPQKLISEFQNDLLTWNEVSNVHPWYALSQLIEFRQNVLSALQKIQGQRSAAHFQNPMISDALLKLKTLSIYPVEHPDLYVEICTTSPQALNASLRELTLKVQDNHGTTSHVLELGTVDQALVRFHAPQLLLKFTEYILTSALGMPVGTLLKGLKLPTHKDLELVVGNHEFVAEAFEGLNKNCNGLIEKTISKEICRSRIF